MSKKRLICDTNVFYDLGARHCSKGDICCTGEQIHYSPLSVLEIAGELSDRNFAGRKAAAQAILDVGAIQLPDPDSFAAQVYGYAQTEPPFDLADAVVAITQSNDMESLQACVDTGEARKWKHRMGTEWHDDMLDCMRRDIPGFATWYDPDPRKRLGRPPTLKGEEKGQLQTRMRSEEWLSCVVVARQPQCAYGGESHPCSIEPTPKQEEHCKLARERIRCYARVYGEYLVYLETERALPDPNDNIDLQLLIHCIDDDHLLVTSDRKWLRLATQAGYSQRVRTA